MSVSTASAAAGFQDVFGKPPRLIARAPGRVNLIGEHTDYNDGFVLPMALEEDTVVAAGRNPADEILVHAAAFDQTVRIELSHPKKPAETPWANYITGLAAVLRQSGHPVKGAMLWIDGTVPLGCGLSSSASLEVAALIALQHLNQIRLDGIESAKICQRVENEYLGLHSGIMDQFVSRMGERGHALFLDCRTLAYDKVPFSLGDTTLIVSHSGVARGLTASKYNERVSECRAAVAALQQAGLGKGAALRDYTRAQLDSIRPQLDATIYRRARHVITENDRTRAAREALRSGDAKRFGALMDASDESLRQDYAVTGPELDRLTAIAREIPGCYGARMTGAGFGGCTINLVARASCADFVRELKQRFTTEFGTMGIVFEARAGAGASVNPCP